MSEHVFRILNLVCASLGMIEGAYRFVNGNPMYLSAWFVALINYAIFASFKDFDELCS